MNNFQTILSAFFLAIFVFAVLIFAGIINIGNGGTDSGLKGKIVVWGTLSSSELYKVFENATGDNQDLYISYVRKSESTYNQDLVEALANDSGPDLFLITPDMVIKNQSYIYKIPYESYPEKVFRNSFIEGASVYLDTDGIIALPILVDPLVMYYNKNILSNEGLVNPPTYWDELFNLNSRLTKSENNGLVNQSMIALGRYDNVKNAKSILSALLFQNGNSIITRGEDGKYSVSINDRSAGSSKSMLEVILGFLTEFSNPSNLAYSWNRSLSNSFDMFTSGKLALYLGKASELFKIESANPNLSFDVTQVLQTRGTNKKTSGDIYAIAVNKKSKNLSLAFNIAGTLSGPEVVGEFSTALSLPPASRQALSTSPADPYLYTFYNSAIFTETWFDPSQAKTDSIFGEMFNSILSNSQDISSATSRAESQLGQLFK